MEIVRAEHVIKARVSRIGCQFQERLPRESSLHSVQFVLGIRHAKPVQDGRGKVHGATETVRFLAVKVDKRKDSSYFDA